MLIESKQFDLEQGFGVLSDVTAFSAADDERWVGIVDLAAYASFQNLPKGRYDLYVLRGTLCESTVTYQRDTFMSRFDLTTLCAGIDGALVWMYCDRNCNDAYDPIIIESFMVEWIPGGVSGMRVAYLLITPNARLMLVSWTPGTHVRAHVHPFGEEFFVLEGVLNDSINPTQLMSYPAGNWQRLHSGAAHALSAEINTTILLRHFSGN